jgi:predicted lipoprotein with Yx(FWY)xxD motif
VSVAGSRYGRIVVDGGGRALYLFDLERDGTPRCYDACATAWPPYLAPDASASSSELDATRVAVKARRDGRRQVTYNSHPLYYYAGDRAPGQILCQAVAEYGGTWYVVDPKGNRITAT